MNFFISNYYTHRYYTQLLCAMFARSRSNVISLVNSSHCHDNTERVEYKMKLRIPLRDLHLLLTIIYNCYSVTGSLISSSEVQICQRTTASFDPVLDTGESCSKKFLVALAVRSGQVSHLKIKATCFTESEREIQEVYTLTLNTSIIEQHQV